VLQIERGRKRGDLPAWELAQQHAPELLCEILPRSARLAMGALGAVEVEKAEADRTSAKLLSGAIEHTRPGAFDAEYSARYGSGFIPDLNGQPARADLERVKAGQQRQQIVAVFQRRGTAAPSQKAFDLFEKQLRSGVENRYRPFVLVWCHFTIPR
jgi:hypothetical protein